MSWGGKEGSCNKTGTQPLKSSGFGGRVEGYFIIHPSDAAVSWHPDSVDRETPTSRWRATSSLLSKCT